MAELRVLSGKDIRRAICINEMIDAVKTAFIAVSRGDAVMPVRHHIRTTDQKGTALFMPSYLNQTNMFGMKTVTLFKNNPEKGLPFIQGMVALFDGQDGTVKAILDGQTLTSLRTGAASGLATRLLAREDASTVAVFGAGVQGRTQLEAVCAVRNIDVVYIFDVSQSAAAQFASNMSRQLCVDIIVAQSPKAAVSNADIVCTATPSRRPVFSETDIKAGAHVNAVGSYQPHVQEVPQGLVTNSKLVVDHRESALEETGDIIIPIAKGVFSSDRIYAELGEIASGDIIGRTSDEEITCFKSVGVAVQDLTAAAKILEQAVEKNIGSICYL